MHRDFVPDRENFVADVKGKDPQNWREIVEVVDGLAEWSFSGPGPLDYERNSGQQMVLRFKDPVTGLLIWSAWPREEEGAGAKLLLLGSRSSVLEQALSSELFGRLNSLRSNAPLAGEQQFWVLTRDLRTPAALEDFKRTVRWLLERLRSRRANVA